MGFFQEVAGKREMRKKLEVVFKEFNAAYDALDKEQRHVMLAPMRVCVQKFWLNIISGKQGHSDLELLLSRLDILELMGIHRLVAFHFAWFADRAGIATGVLADKNFQQAFNAVYAADAGMQVLWSANLIDLDHSLEGLKGLISFRIEKEENREAFLSYFMFPFVPCLSEAETYTFKQLEDMSAQARTN